MDRFKLQIVKALFDIKRGFERRENRYRFSQNFIMVSTALITMSCIIHMMYQDPTLKYKPLLTLILLGIVPVSAVFSMVIFVLPLAFVFDLFEDIQSYSRNHRQKIPCKINDSDFDEIIKTTMDSINIDLNDPVAVDNFYHRLPKYVTSQWDSLFKIAILKSKPEQAARIQQLPSDLKKIILKSAS